MNLSHKMRVTPTHVYFHGGPFSNWFMSDFVAELPEFRAADGDRGNRIVRSGKPYRFSSGEKWMMASKASVFEGPIKGGALEAIMGTEVLFGSSDRNSRNFMRPMDDVKAIKAVGRTVRGLASEKWDDNDIAFWDRASVPIVTVGLIAKFSQHDGLYEVIREMGDRTFVEGSKFDDVWGVKLDWADPRIEDETNWRGRNKLGKVLNVVNQVFDRFDRCDDPWKAYAEFNRTPPAPKATSLTP
jgi:ribA/ribD-fused uncharacterized protein